VRFLFSDECVRSQDRDGSLKHRLAVGQIVDLKPNSLKQAALGRYEIRSLMPESDVPSDSPRYRIKSVEESHERIAAERDLTVVE
jgi:hypothetical protein